MKQYLKTWFTHFSTPVWLSLLLDYYLSETEKGAGPRKCFFSKEELDIENGMRSNAQTYVEFIYCFARAVVGIKTWKQNTTKTALSEFFTITDEAFLLLCIESYRDKWVELCEQELSNKEELQKSKVVSTWIKIS